MDESKEIMEARRILQDMSSTKRERYLAEQREKWIMDKNAIRADGYNKGKIEEKTEIAKKMKEKHFEISDIIEMTGLTKEEIEKI